MSEKTGKRAHPRTLIGQEVTSLDKSTQNERDDQEVSELMVAHVHQRKRYVEKRLKKRKSCPRRLEFWAVFLCPEDNGQLASTTWNLQNFHISPLMITNGSST